MTELKYCEGCGAALQTEETKKSGYIPNSSLEKGSVICQRCFRIKNYNEVLPIEMDENEFTQILNGIAGTDSLVVNIIDLFDIDGTIIQGLPRFIGGNEFILVANKIDLFPKSMNHNKVENWLAFYAKQHGLKPEKIFLISAEKGFGVEEVATYIKANSKKKDVYVVGATNVGKSSFINKLIKGLGTNKEVELTTSKYPGTTLNTVSIPLKGNHSIIDTPGVIHKERYSEWVEPETLKIISPRKQLKPKVYQLSGEQTLFFGGLARIDQLNPSSNSFVCYLSNELNIHRTKLSKADELYQNHLGEILSPPTKEEAAKLPGFSKHSFKLNEGKTDIVISGLGWVTIDGKANIDVYAPKGIGVHSRKALI